MPPVLDLVHLCAHCRWAIRVKDGWYKPDVCPNLLCQRSPALWLVAKDQDLSVDDRNITLRDLRIRAD